MLTAIAERTLPTEQQLSPHHLSQLVQPHLAAFSPNPQGSVTLRIIRKVMAMGYPKQATVSNALLVFFAWILLLAVMDSSIKMVSHLSSMEDRQQSLQLKYRRRWIKVLGFNLTKILEKYKANCSFICYSDLKSNSTMFKLCFAIIWHKPCLLRHDSAVKQQELLEATETNANSIVLPLSTSLLFNKPNISLYLTRRMVVSYSWCKLAHLDWFQGRF